MKWYVLAHSDIRSNRTYELWSEADLQKNPGAWNRNGRRGEVAGTFDTEQAAVEAVQRYERSDEDSGLGFDPDRTA